MKKMDYKTTKWEKRQKNLVECGKWDIEQTKMIEKQFDSGKMDGVRFYYSLALNYVNIAEYYYVINNKRECFEAINKLIELFEKCVHLLNSGEPTLESTKKNILKKIDIGYFGYFALILERRERLEKIVSKESGIFKMLNDITLEETNSEIEMMQNAIVLRDSELFNRALLARIKEIRKFNLDNYLCVDFMSIALIKLANEYGMVVDGNYAEVDCQAI